MKLKEIKFVLNSEKIAIYTGFSACLTFSNIDNEYIRENEEETLNMFDTFGEFEIEQLYGGDSETIYIDVALLNKQNLGDDKTTECHGCGEEVKNLIEGTEICSACYEEEIKLLKASNENNFNISIMYRRKWKDSEKENKELKEELLKIRPKY